MINGKNPEIINLIDFIEKNNKYLIKLKIFTLIE
jgi:hypothetical protein